MSSSKHLGLCGPKCSYRSLYTGSQESLRDMSGRQAEALNRLSRLRDGIIQRMKQSRPGQFADAEQVNGRMSRADDEMLLAYLQGFLTSPVPDTAATAAAAAATGSATRSWDPLRRALAELGVPLPAADDPDAWAQEVRRWGTSAAAPQVSVTPPATPGGAPQVRVSDNRVVPPVTPDLDEPPAWDEPPVDLDADRWSGGYDTDLPEPGPEPEESLSLPGFTGAFGDGEPGGDRPADPADLTSLFDDDPVPAPDPRPVSVMTTAVTAAPEQQPEPAPQPGAAPQAEPEPLTVGSLAEVLRLQQESQRAQLEPVPQEAVTTAATSLPAPEPAPATGSGNKTSRTAGPVKPELFPAAKPVKKAAPRPPRRTTRVSAAAPEGPVDTQALAEAAAGGEVTQQLQDQLLAAVCIPRPVFTSDLAQMVGDATLVQQWEQHCRAMGTAGPLRFIMAKPRHRARGNLVLPFDKNLRKTTAEFDKSLWNRCLTELKGAKLYEVAVLLHRFGDKIVTAEVKDKTVTLRVNQPRGLVGVVVALDTDLDPGDATRTALANEVEDLLASRLSLLAVVTSAAGNKPLTDLAEALRDEARDRAWAVTTPVIAAHSWDFASDGGTSAVSVLG